MYSNMLNKYEVINTRFTVYMIQSAKATALVKIVINISCSRNSVIGRHNYSCVRLPSPLPL